jgi:hypothetical protein
MSATKAIGSLFVLLGLFLAVDYVILRLPFAEAILQSDLKKTQEKQIDIYIEINKQLLGLATLVIAGIGLNLNLQQGGPGSPRRSRPILIGSLVMAAFSIYAGYLSYDKLVWMLASNFFNLETPLLYALRVLQFWAFVSSLFLFAWFWLTTQRS